MRHGVSRVTRLAPSPTGTLHLGNARTFLLTWAIARCAGWKVVLRIEDLDVSRVRAGAAEQACSLLAWLGIDWDEGPHVQTRDLVPYANALERLVAARRAYACALTRKQVDDALSAPHAADIEQPFSSRLRPAEGDRESWRAGKHNSNYRFVVPDERIDVTDEFSGTSRHRPAGECGDFIIWTKSGLPAYQLAVVVDDVRQGITDVVRGDDLLPSAARQTLLYRALDLRPPQWWHLPLVLDDQGRRLAKRDGSTHLAGLREACVAPERVIGLLAAWSGVGNRHQPRSMSAEEFRATFRLDMLSKAAVRCTAADLAWLTGASSSSCCSSRPSRS